MLGQKPFLGFGRMLRLLMRTERVASFCHRSVVNYDNELSIAHFQVIDTSYSITVLNLAKGALELFESLGKSSNVAKQRDLLNFLLQNCAANEKNLEFSLRSPFNYILTFANQPTWLRG